MPVAGFVILESNKIVNLFQTDDVLIAACGTDAGASQALGYAHAGAEAGRTS